MKKQPSNRLIAGETIALWMLAILGASVLAAILWSFFTDTLQPLLHRGAYWQAASNILGFGLILTGLGFLIFGGLSFLAGSYQTLQSPLLRKNREQIRANTSPESVRQARHENMRLLWRTWKSALRWIGLGILLITLGAPFTWNPPFGLN